MPTQEHDLPISSLSLEHSAFCKRNALLLLLWCLLVICPASWHALSQSILQLSDSQLSHSQLSVYTQHGLASVDSLLLKEDRWAASQADYPAILAPHSGQFSWSVLRHTDTASKRFGPPDAFSESDVFLAACAAHGLPPLEVRLTAPVKRYVAALLPAHRGLIRYALAPPVVC